MESLVAASGLIASAGPGSVAGGVLRVFLLAGQTLSLRGKMIVGRS